MPVAGGQSGDHGAGSRGERSRGGALAEPDHAQQRRVPDHDEPGRSDREGKEPAEQDRAWPDPVGQRPEDGFEQHLRAVIHGEQHPEGPERHLLLPGVAAQARGDAVRAERGDESRRVEREQHPAAGDRCGGQWSARVERSPQDPGAPGAATSSGRSRVASIRCTARIRIRRSRAHPARVTATPSSSPAATSNG